jgi:DhnA family fructose-bisphosphate aldolase class Ia
MSDLDFGRLRELRATRPQAVAEAAVRRQRRPLLGGDGRLMIVAADHPARGALGVRTVADAMGDRYDLLRRLVTALRRPGVDGVLGTPDILEDLLLLGALDNKVVIGSMNRGGLQGSTFELDDRFTGYDAASIAAMGFDGGKMLTRIDLADPGTVATLEASGRAVTELAAHGIMAMVEPFMSRRVDGRVVNDLGAAAVVKSMTIASGLGVTSAYTWLKLPVVDDMATVMAATTLPTLLLGGDPSGHPEETYAKWRGALALPGVRGLVVGRALLYPPDGDVAAAVDEAVSLVRADLGVTA